MRPRARTEDLVVSEVDGEVLIYDTRRHRAHCLNGPAASVWQHCDGQRSVEELAAMVQPTDGTEAEIVQFALRQLDRAHLLEDRLEETSGQITRQQLLRKAGKTGAAVALLPVVASIVSPTIAAAASCVPKGSSCSGLTSCCSGCACIGGTCRGTC